MSDGSGVIGDAIKFLLDGEEVEALPGETIWQVANRQGTEIPHLCYTPAPGLPPRRQLPRLHGRDRGRARAGRLLHPQARGRHEGEDRAASAPSSRARWCSSCWSPISPTRAGRITIPIPRFWRWADRIGVEPEPLPGACTQPAPDRSPSRDGGQSRRLHRMQSLRPRLPRGPGQRRHRHGRARPRAPRSSSTSTIPWASSTCVACGECVQACPTGALMPATWSKRARASAPRRPTARSTASAPIAASAARSPTRSRTTSCSMSTAATARPIQTGSASRAASASTTSAIPHRLTKPLIRKDGVPKHGR